MQSVEAVLMQACYVQTLLEEADLPLLMQGLHLPLPVCGMSAEAPWLQLACQLTWLDTLNAAATAPQRAPSTSTRGSSKVLCSWYSGTLNAGEAPRPACIPMASADPYRCAKAYTSGPLPSSKQMRHCRVFKPTVWATPPAHRSTTDLSPVTPRQPPHWPAAPWQW